MHSTRTLHLFTRFSIPIAAFLLLIAVVILLAAGCGGEEPASSGSDATPQGTAESRSRESGPGSGSASTNTPEPTAQQRSDTAGAETPDPARRGQSGGTPGQTEQPAATTTAGGQSGGTAAQTEEPATTVAPEATMAPTATPASPACSQRQPAPNVMLPAAQTSPETDKETLIALFNATDGESWDSSRTWLGRAPVGEWEGVSTDDQGRVTSLHLTGLRLTGELPPELGNLTMLQSLYLGRKYLGDAYGEKYLNGEIPPELGNLANLQHLSIEGQLSGVIPPELGNLASLQQMNLQSNQLCGEIPPGLGNLSNLNWLFLSGNQLSGEIPAELGNLSNLRSLFLNENQLSGQIPPELGNLSNLNRLSLSENQLSGQIPPELENLMPTLEGRFTTVLDSWMVEGTDIDLSHNQFSGCVSDYVSDFYGGWNSGLPVCTPPDHAGDTETLVALYDTWGRPHLENWLGREPLAKWEGVSVDASGRVVALTVNSRRGSPVPELANLDKLRVLHFDQAREAIPRELGNLGDLQVLVLSGGWEIPPELGNLGDLQVLILSRFEGEIPPELGNLGSLQILELSGSGEIPAELGNLTNLRALGFSGYLSGEIPQELGKLSKLEALNIRDTNWSGCVPASLREQGVSLSGADFCPQ